MKWPFISRVSVLKSDPHLMCKPRPAHWIARKSMDSGKMRHKRPFPRPFDLPNKGPQSPKEPMNEPQITPELVASHGLKPDEYERILKLIGRVPSFTELGIFSAMWNEHCSYKSSRLHLRGPADQGAVGDPGAGRERRRDRHRRRPGGRVQDGEPQPSELHRALSGRDHRRRRHLARRVHDGRASDRLPQCAELWRAGTSEDAPSGVGRGRRRRRLRQFVRRADRRRAGAFPHPL